MDDRENRFTSVIMDMNKNLENTTMQEIKEKSCGHFRFPVYHSKAFMESDIEDLDLTVRSRNCLKRAGYNTVGELVSGINGSADLQNIRNCGKKSVDEIMSHLFFYTYMLLAPEKRKAYMQEIERLNGFRN